MSDTDDYRFDPDDVTNEDESVNTDGGNFLDGVNTTGLTLLPLLVVAVYAIADKAVVVAAIESLIGASGLTTAIVTALSIVGGITVASLVIISVGTVIAILLALTRQSLTLGVISGLSVIGHILVLGLAHFVFTEVPLLVGVVLALNLVAYGAFMLIGAISILGALAVID